MDLMKPQNYNNTSVKSTKLYSDQYMWSDRNKWENSSWEQDVCETLQRRREAGEEGRRGAGAGGTQAGGPPVLSKLPPL